MHGCRWCREKREEAEWGVIQGRAQHVEVCGSFEQLERERHAVGKCGLEMPPNTDSPNKLTLGGRNKSRFSQHALLLVLPTLTLGRNLSLLKNTPEYLVTKICGGHPYEGMDLLRSVEDV